jgi:two-component system heavy metal sensor histidine kinase CusS
MRRTPSLAFRLILLFGMVAAIVFAGFGWIIERSIEDHFVMEDSAELNVIARAVSQALASAKVTDNAQGLAQRFQDILVGHHGAALYVARQDGQVLFSSPGAQHLSSISADKGHNGLVRSWSDVHHTYRVLIKHSNGNINTVGLPYTMWVAVVIDHHLRFLEGFRKTLWLMIFSGILVTALMGCVAVRQGHAPLRNIIAQIHTISANRLNTRLSPDTVPRELTDLAVSFNDMLGRMEESFQRLANFSADIAHELRTPVTNLLTQTQVALSQSRNVEDYREILYSNIEEYERMAQMIGDMLFLAKTDNGLYEPNAEPIDLALEVQNLFDYYEAWAEERGVSLLLKGAAQVRGDSLMIRRALSNLLSNAIKHTPAKGAATVYLEQTPLADAFITVENPGPAIPAEHLPKLFDRFYRVDASRQRSIEGAGLGLAIVKSIVDIHGGKIEVTSVEGCTRFRIVFPGARTAK